MHRRLVSRIKDRSPSRRSQKAKYDAAHRRQRRQWAKAVGAAPVHCWRCGQLITGEWHLGHRPGLPSHPEHVECNLRNSNEGRTR